MFEDVVDILDPEMNLASDEEDGDYVDDQETGESQFTPQAAPQQHTHQKPEPEKQTSRDGYVFNQLLNFRL